MSRFRQQEGNGVSASGARGFSVIEMMVAMFVAVIILTAAFKLFAESSYSHHRYVQKAEMRQNARAVIEFASRDLFTAGFGLTQLPAAIPVIIANEPTVLTTFSSSTLTIRANIRDISTGIEDAMPATSSELKVTSSAGFQEGMRVMIWNTAGFYDWLVITQVQNSAGHLQHNNTNTSISYQPDNSAIGLIEEIVYRYNAAAMRVERKTNDGSWIGIADNVEELTFRYYDEDNVEIFPNSDALRRSVRKMGIRVRSRTDQIDRRTGRRFQFAMTTEIDPKNLAYLPEA